MPRALVFVQLADGVHEIESELSGLKSSAPRRASFCQAVARVVDDWISQMARRTCSAVDKLTSGVE